MKVSEMISQLQAMQNELGDVDVLITDGYQARCYRGDYAVMRWIDDDGNYVVDIGIGGCEE